MAQLTATNILSFSDWRKHTAAGKLVDWFKRLIGEERTATEREVDEVIVGWHGVGGFAEQRFPRRVICDDCYDSISRHASTHGAAVVGFS